MENPVGRALMAKVQELNEMARRARSGEPTAEDYLRAVHTDPATEWYSQLLREKSEELEQVRQQSDELIHALKTWHDTHIASGAVTEADVHLIETLRRRGVIDNNN